MHDGEPNMYTALAILRNGQTQLQWNRIQMLLGFNAIAIPIIFGATQSGQAKLVVSIVGFAVHLILIVSAIRASGWIDYWDERITDLEKLDSEEGNPNGIRVQVFSREEFSFLKARGRVLNKVFIIAGFIFMLFWIGSWIYILV